MQLTSPLLTFIIPAYNVEKYLSECLDSLLHQTENDHKIIVVNDGSKDSTGDIAKRYAANYPDMIQYVEQKNQGLGAARNTGLSMVNTEYVTFLDSDDWQDCLFVEKVKRELARQEEKVDIVFTLPWIYNSATHQIEEWHDRWQMENLFYKYDGEANNHSRVLNVKSERGLGLYGLEASSCRRVYRTEFLQSINFRFPVGVKWEDVQPHFIAIHHARHCIGVKETGFFYRINTGNQITSGGGASRLDIVPVFRDTMQMAIHENWSDKEIAYIFEMFWKFALWSVDITNSEYIDKLLQELHVFIGTIPKQYINIYIDEYSQKHRKDKLLILLLKSPLYCLLKDYRIRQMYGRLASIVQRMLNKLRRS